MPSNEKNLSLFKYVTKKPISPEKKEIEENIRSRSAKLRHAIRNKNSFFYPEEFKSKFSYVFELESALL